MPASSSSSSIPKETGGGFSRHVTALDRGYPSSSSGGERAHVPLEATGGELVAKLVVEERVSVLLDLSLFRKHEDRDVHGDVS